MAKILVQDTSITILSIDSKDYISLTDIAKYKTDDPPAVIANWMRNRNTIEYLGIWESLYNPNFNPLEFEGFRNQAGLNAFTLSPTQWIETTSRGDRHRVMREKMRQLIPQHLKDVKFLRGAPTFETPLTIYLQPITDC